MGPSRRVAGEECLPRARARITWHSAAVSQACAPGGGDAIGSCKPESQQPCGARRRTGICCVAAPRRCHHIACVAAPCICPSGARARMPTYSCANPKLREYLCKTSTWIWTGMILFETGLISRNQCSILDRVQVHVQVHVLQDILLNLVPFGSGSESVSKGVSAPSRSRSRPRFRS